MIDPLGAFLDTTVCLEPSSIDHSSSNEEMIAKFVDRRYHAGHVARRRGSINRGSERSKSACTKLYLHNVTRSNMTEFTNGNT